MTCAKRNCPECAQVDQADRVKPVALPYLPGRIALGAEATEIAASHYEADNPAAEYWCTD